MAVGIPTRQSVRRPRLGERQSVLNPGCGDVPPVDARQRPCANSHCADCDPTLGVPTVGLVVNIVGMLLLRRGSTESLNLKGAYFEVLADMLSSLGVIAAGLIMWRTQWYFVGPAAHVDANARGGRGVAGGNTVGRQSGQSTRWDRRNAWLDGRPRPARVEPDIRAQRLSAHAVLAPGAE